MTVDVADTSKVRKESTMQKSDLLHLNSKELWKDIHKITESVLKLLWCTFQNQFNNFISIEREFKGENKWMKAFSLTLPHWPSTPFWNGHCNSHTFKYLQMKYSFRLGFLQKLEIQIPAQAQFVSIEIGKNTNGIPDSCIHQLRL